MLSYILWMILALDALLEACPLLEGRNIIEQIFGVVVIVALAPFIHAVVIIKACYYLLTGEAYEIYNDDDDFLDKINRR